MQPQLHFYLLVLRVLPSEFLNKKAHHSVGFILDREFLLMSYLDFVSEALGAGVELTTGASTTLAARLD